MDKGVEFVLNEFKKAINTANRYTELNELLGKIKKEYKRIQNMTKTGDVYDHFLKFSYGNNQHKDEFEKFKKYNLITNEEMAEVIKTKFPGEINNKSSIMDFKRGKLYSSYQINSIFEVSDQGGGIRASNTTNRIVLTIKNDNGIYFNK